MDDLEEMDIYELYEYFITVVNDECLPATQRRIIDIVDAIIDWFGGIPE